MGNFRPIPTKCWTKFLEHHGWKFTGRINGSHHIYKKTGAIRSIPVWSDKKEIPPSHIVQSLKTMGIDKKVAIDWFEKNC